MRTYYDFSKMKRERNSYVKLLKQSIISETAPLLIAD